MNSKIAEVKRMKLKDILKKVYVKTTPLIISISLLVMIFSPLIGIVPNVKGTSTTFISDASKDGYIESSDAVYSNALITPLQTIDDLSIKTGQLWNSFLLKYGIMKGYFSFETSTIDNNILSATLNCKLRHDFSYTDFDVKVDNTEYGTLDNDDWNATGTYEGILFNTAGISMDTWYSMSLNITNINTTGDTQYIINSSRIGTIPTDREYVTIYSADNSGNEPYLTVVTETPLGAIIIYNFTQAGMINRTIQILPTVTDYNTTHELLKYEFWSLNQTFLNMSLDSNYTFNSISPWANISNYGNGIFNISQTYNNSFYWVWFFREKALVESTIHIALSHATLGSGFFWENWQVVINPSDGIGYNNTSASRIWNPDYDVTYGNSYTVSVLDWFTPPNHITNTTFVANALEMDINIPVPVYQLNLNSFRMDTTAYAIYYNASGTPYQSHLPSEKWTEIAVREGSYMFRFDYLDSTVNGSTSVTTTIFYNLTIDSTFTINIGINKIDIIITDIQGNLIIIETISTAVTGPVFLVTTNMPIAITDPGTRASLVNFASGYFILVHPFSVVEAKVHQNESGVTSAEFWDARPQQGEVVVITDLLTIISPFGTTVMLNYTNGTNFMTTTFPGIISMKDFNVNNFTAWTSNGTSFFRVIHFVQASVMRWDDHRSDGYMESTTSINNTTPFDWIDARWMIPVSGNDTLDSKWVMVYDMSNRVELDKGENYSVDSFSFFIRFGSLPSGSFLPHKFTYFTEEAEWIFGTPEIIILQMNIKKIMNENYWYGVGTWTNPESALFNEEIKISVRNLQGDVDPDSIFVTDTDENSISHSHPSISKSSFTITIPYTEVGEVGPGKSRTYEVHFQYEGIQKQDFPWSLFYIISFIILFILTMLTVASNEKNRPSFGLALAIGTIISLMIGLIAWAFT